MTDIRTARRKHSLRFGALLPTLLMLVPACDREQAITAPQPTLLPAPSIDRLPPLNFRVLEGGEQLEPEAITSRIILVPPQVLAASDRGSAAPTDLSRARSRQAALTSTSSDYEDPSVPVPNAAEGWIIAMIQRDHGPGLDWISTGAGTRIVSGRGWVETNSTEYITRDGMNPISNYPSCAFFMTCSWSHRYSTECESISTYVYVSSTHQAFWLTQSTPQFGGNNSKNCDPPPQYAGGMCDSDGNPIDTDDGNGWYPCDSFGGGGGGGGGDGGGGGGGDGGGGDIVCTEYVMEVSYDDGATWTEVDRWWDCR